MSEEIKGEEVPNQAAAAVETAQPNDDSEAKMDEAKPKEESKVEMMS